jgi:hypothetical protein
VVALVALASVFLIVALIIVVIEKVRSEQDRQTLKSIQLDVKETVVISLEEKSSSLQITVQVLVDIDACFYCDVTAFESDVRAAIRQHIAELSTDVLRNPIFEIRIGMLKSRDHNFHRVQAKNVTVLSVTPSNYAEQLNRLAGLAAIRRNDEARKIREQREAEERRIRDWEENRGRRIYRHHIETEERSGGKMHYYKDTFTNKKGDVWCEHTEEFEEDYYDDD